MNAPSRLAAASLVLLMAGSLAVAEGGAYKSSKHGDRRSGVRRSKAPVGSCAQCHVAHGSGPAPADRRARGLFAPNDNGLCATCHSAASALQIYPGAIAYTASSHATSPSAIWPGPSPLGRAAADAGKCVNCHTPHGASDSTGVIPSMTFAREEKLCLACHHGVTASDQASLFRKTFRHPVELSGIHDAEQEAGRPDKFARKSRHAECVDCHNPHTAEGDKSATSAPEASARLKGVGRVTVTNGAAGAVPLYTWAGPQDSAFAKEYEVCFKCHSSWTTLPAGKTDLALLLNPANASYHPVEKAGKNNIAADSFVDPWTRSSVTYCSDCHGSDDPQPTPRGPHGSSYRFLLKSRYTVQTGGGAMLRSDLCFSCHRYDTYANPAAPPDSLRASRFNPPGSASGHASHVGGQGLSCWSCHETHGSVLQPALISTRRSPGMVSYSQSVTGGTCLPSCHKSPGVRSYATNYGR